MKRDYLKAKTVDLLLDEPAESLLKVDPQSGKQRLSIQLPSSIHEELHNIEGVEVLKAQGRGLKLEIDTARSKLEPIIAAIMQRCHILDMTITDPPMEEIIATIYREKRQEEVHHEIHTFEHGDDRALLAVPPSTTQASQEGEYTAEAPAQQRATMLTTSENSERLHAETGASFDTCQQALLQSPSRTDALQHAQRQPDEQTCERNREEGAQ